MTAGAAVLALLLLSLTQSPGPAPAARPEDAVFRALAREIARARAELRLDGQPPPYFIAASVTDWDQTTVSATLGALHPTQRGHDRFLEVRVRVGDRSFDSSRFVRLKPLTSLELPEPPEGDDELELRRALWLALDRAYKDAVEDLARKKAVLEGRATERVETRLPDLGDDRPAPVVVPPAPRPPPPIERWEVEARELSRVFRDFPELHASGASFSALARTTRYLDSDGGRAFHAQDLAGFEAGAETQADDGMPLHDFASAYGRAPADLPDRKALGEMVRDLGRRLGATRASSPLAEPYVGPVLLEDQAAAELLLALAGWSAAVAREPVLENPRMSAFVERFGLVTRWKGRLGTRVAADLLDLADDPTRRAHGSVPLIGSYAADDEGVPAQAVKLVERGILKGILATRTPVKGAPRSNGHARSFIPNLAYPFGGPRPAPAVLVATAANPDPVSPAEVRARFLETLRARDLEAGYAVRRIQNEASNPWQNEEMVAAGGATREEEEAPVEPPLVVMRVAAADGAETPVRGVRWSGIDVRALKDMLFASSGEGGEAALNLRLAPPGVGARGFGGSLPASVVCPRAIVIDDLELGPATGPFPAPPVLERPGSTAER